MKALVPLAIALASCGPSDAEIHAENEERRFFPPDMKCAPTFDKFQAALQHAVNDSPITDALVSIESASGSVVLGSDHCSADVLSLVFKFPKVNRLLMHCKIPKIQCRTQNAALDLTW